MSHSVVVTGECDVCGREKRADPILDPQGNLAGYEVSCPDRWRVSHN